MKGNPTNIVGLAFFIVSTNDLWTKQIFDYQVEIFNLFELTTK